MSKEDEEVKFEEFWSERRENLSKEIEEKMRENRDVSSIKNVLFSCRRAVQDLLRGVHSGGSSMD